MIELRARCQRHLTIVGTLFLAMCFGPFAGASIENSAHDFSVAVGTICDPCHTPHNADSTIPDAPLWNHTVTVATYQTYESPTMDTPVGQPAGVSRLCLSCHDGTIAVDNYGGAPPPSTGTIGGNGLIGTDLRDDHPISIDWNDPTAGHLMGEVVDCSKCHSFSGPDPRELVFFDGYIECATCHDVHNDDPSIPQLLRITMVGSELCLTCHQNK